MEPNIGSSIPVMSTYYNPPLEFIYFTYLTDIHKLSDFKIENDSILHIATFHISKINTKNKINTTEKRLLSINCMLLTYLFIFLSPGSK